MKILFILMMVMAFVLLFLVVTGTLESVVRMQRRRLLKFHRRINRDLRAAEPMPEVPLSRRERRFADKVAKAERLAQRFPSSGT